MEAPRGDATASYDAACDRILVRACLLELTEVDRQALELHLFHGWSAEEIGGYVGADALEVSRSVAAALDRINHRRGEVLAASPTADAGPDAGPHAPDTHVDFPVWGVA